MTLQRSHALRAFALFLITLFLAGGVSAQIPDLPLLQTVPVPPDPMPLPAQGDKAYFARWLAVDGRSMLAVPASARAAYAYRKNDAGYWIYDGPLSIPGGAGWFSGGALSDRTAVLATGAGGETSGFLYVFLREGGAWRLVQTLTDPAPGVSEFNYFGYQLAFSGTTLVVTNFSGGEGQGAAHVYSKNAAGRLVYQTTLTRANTGAFGWSVAVDGERIAIGSLEEGGSVHLFQRSRGEWNHAQTLKSPPVGGDPGVQQYFGNSVALSGKTLIVASPNADLVWDPFGSGAAFVYRRNGSTWELEEKLVNPSGHSGQFGVQVAANGDRTAVGVPGAVYTFTRGAAGWTPDGQILGDPLYGLGYTLVFDRRILIAPEVSLPNPSSPVFDGRVGVYGIAAAE